jgi:hypothetical protein
MKFLPVIFILIGLACALIATLMPVATPKGRIRLASSLAVGLGFIIGAIGQVVEEGNIWPGGLGFVVGIFLSWIGVRKYHRDPKGKTRANQML